MEEKKQKESLATEQAAAPKKKKWKKIVGGIFTALVVLVLVFCIVIVVQVKRSNKPFFFGYGTYFVLTGSMEPTIHVGDVIIVEKVDSIEDLTAMEDIVTYHGKEGEFAGKTVTHRIVKIDGDTIVTKGDSTMSIKEDPAITFDDVIGRYVRTSSFLTTVYSIFTSKYGFLFIVIIPLLILLAVQIINFRRACKMDKDGKMPEEKSAEEVKAQAVKEKEEEIKRKAIEDYLASKKRIEKAQKDKKNDR